jgi:hypothetical protein
MLALAAGLAVAGCGQVDTRPAAWGYISPALFQPNCATASCHSPAAAVSGLDFSTPDNGYASLTRLKVIVLPYPDGGGTTGLPPCPLDPTKACESRPLVTPYDPAGSRLVNMLRARDAPRMPPDRPLPEADIRLVERWILNGATDPDFSLRDAGGDAARVDGGAADGRPADARPADALPADAQPDRDGATGDGGRG